MAVLGGFRKLSINENVNYEGFFRPNIYSTETSVGTENFRCQLKTYLKSTVNRSTLGTD